MFKDLKMRSNTTYVMLFLGIAIAATNSFVLSPRNGSSSFAGSNEYFLHALPAAERKTYVETLAGWGVKVLRIWGKWNTLSDHV